MAGHRTIAVTGLRTAAQPGLREEIGSALAVVAGRHDLWLLGALGFALRGGIVVLALPLLVLPTPVEVRLALGSSLGSTGLTADFWTLVGQATIAATVVAIVCLQLLARLERSVFERVLADPELDESALPGSLVPALAGRPAALSTRLYAVQAMTLVAVLLSAVPLAAAVGQVTLDEILRPSSGASIYVRVAGQVLPSLAFAVAAVLLIDTFSALTSRDLLITARVAPDGRPRRLSAIASFGRALRGALVRPLPTIGRAAVGWLATIVVLVPIGAALTVAWQATRASFLSTTSLADLFSDPGTFVVALMLSAVFVVGLTLAGCVSAFRAALWTIAALRRQRS